MLSGDGLIVRIRLSCGDVSPALAAEISDCAQGYGNGVIDLTGRGNLQIRGVSEATWEPLIERLSARGLVDASTEAEAVRNVLVSPFAGFFPDTPDVRPTARALEAALGEDRTLWRLPSKFGFSIDAGAFPLGDFRADVAFKAAADGAFYVRLAGAEDRPLGPVAAGRVVAIARAVVALFLADREGKTAPPRRLRDLVHEVGIEALSARLGLSLAERTPSPLARPTHDILGCHETAGGCFVGVGLPFGRTSAREFSALAKLAAAAGAQGLRLTPWRAIVILGVAPLKAAALMEGLKDLQLILDAYDPRLSVAACPGAPDCTSSSIRTREIAQSLAPLAARAGATLHVSGCAKGCAYPRAAPFTVVGRGGRFDLVLGGKADAAPDLSALDREQLIVELGRRLRPPAEANIQ
jgi:precorrin-3B synthase